MIQRDEHTDDEWLWFQEDIRNMNSVTIKSFNISNVKSVIITKLETSITYVRYQIEYKAGSDGNLMQVGLF